MADLDYYKIILKPKVIVGSETTHGPGGDMHHVVQEGLCTTWSRRGRAPRGPGGGVHHVVQEGACATWSRRVCGLGGGMHQQWA